MQKEDPIGILETARKQTKAANETVKAAFQILDVARETIDSEIKQLPVNTHRAEAIGHSIKLYGALIRLLATGNSAREAGIHDPLIHAFLDQRFECLE